MTLAEARAIRADATSHPDRAVISACEAICRLSQDQSEKDAAAAMLALLEGVV